jgi:hypothetical protein
MTRCSLLLLSLLVISLCLEAIPTIASNDNQDLKYSQGYRYHQGVVADDRLDFQDSGGVVSFPLEYEVLVRRLIPSGSIRSL